MIDKTGKRYGSDTQKIIFLLVGIWLFYLLSLGFLQKIGLLFGFHVLPGGEDFNWTGFIADAKRVHYLPSIARNFWTVDGRNPLSPWYWIAVAPLIIKSEFYLYFIRCLMDPVLAITFYFLISRLCKKPNTLFAFSVALVTLFWNFFILFSHIIWVFHCALVFSLFSLFFYCRYVDEDRANSGSDLALSLLCFLVAIATYSLQAGSMIGIVFISFFRKPFSFRNMMLAVKDISFFLALFIIYYLIWDTVSPFVDSYVSTKVLTFHWHQLIQSLQVFLFDHNYLLFFDLLKTDWKVMLPVFVILAACFGILFFKLTRSRFLDDTTDLSFGWIVVLLVSITGPTLVLESTSNTFMPGTRSPMISQAFQPLLYLTFVFIFARVLPFPKKIKTNVAIVLITLLTAVTATVSIEYNHALIKRTIKREEILRQAALERSMKALPQKPVPASTRY